MPVSIADDAGRHAATSGAIGILTLLLCGDTVALERLSGRAGRVPVWRKGGLHLAQRFPLDIEERLRVLVERGRFRDTTDALLAAVRLLEEHDQRLARLQADLRVGEDQAMRGELIDFTPELLDELSREAEERSRCNEPIRDEVKP